MARNSEVLAHWHLLIDSFSTSALSYYESVESALGTREVPGIRFGRTIGKESGIFSAKREYLRVTRDRTVIDICAAQYGTSYFFSWWMTEQPMQHVLLYACALVFLSMFVLVTAVTKLGVVIGPMAFVAFMIALLWYVRAGLGSLALILEDAIVLLPIAGAVYLRFFKPLTYFAMDSEIMFRESVHRAVTEMIDTLRSGHGLRSLSPTECEITSRRVVRD